MCHYCHVLKNNPSAPIHLGVRCLDCSNTYSKVPMTQRTYNRGKPISLLPTAPPATEESIKKPIPRTKSLFGWFMKIFNK